MTKLTRTRHNIQMERLRTISQSVGLGVEDVALFALQEIRERDSLARQAAEEIEALRGAARALLADVRSRYPGEELRCPYMRALDAVANPPSECNGNG